MVNEKMKILKMLEEGRISAEDAEKLLSATDFIKLTGEDSNVPSLGYHPSTGAKTIPNDNGERPITPPAKPPAPPPGSTTAADLTKKLETLFNKMEPKLQSFAEFVVEKTGSAASAISKNIAQATATRQSQSPPESAPLPPPEPPPMRTPPPQVRATPAAPAPKSRVERAFEMNVPSAGSELVLDGINGQILLKGYNGDKITAKVRYTVKRGNPTVEMITLGSKFYLNYDENELDSISVDAYIPASMFSSIRVTNTNGPLIIATVTADDARFENMNGDIEITGLTAKNLLVETNNGSLRLSDIGAERAAIDNFNGAVHAANIDAAQMKMSAINGGVTMQMSGFNRYREYAWGIESNNGKAALVMPSSVDIGYHISASAALSEVRLGLTGLTFLKNTRSEVEVLSTNFDLAPRKVTMLLESSSQPIIVN